MRMLVAAILVFGMASAVQATVIEPQTSPNGVRWVSGGVGMEERSAIALLEGEYTLKIITAAKQKTAYATDVQFAIRDAGGAIVLDGQVEGPWTLVKLSPGTYIVEVTSRGEMQAQKVTVGDGPRAQIAFYFDRPNI
jgi:hypothetical protein